MVISYNEEIKLVNGILRASGFRKKMRRSLQK